MEYTIENLDELYNAKETAILRKGVTKSQYDKAINRLTLEKNDKMAEFDKDITAIETLIEMIVGDNDEIETPAGKFIRKPHDPKKPASYDVSIKSDKDTIEALEKSKLLAAAIKTETKEVKSVNKTPIKELLASGAIAVSNDGHLVTENGEILEIEARLKPVDIKFKAKK